MRRILGCLLCLLTLPVVATERVALVIGNAAYVENPLANPRNDAAAISARLRDFEFDVVEVLDADLDDMQGAVLDFATRIKPTSTALVFYAGHGIQANGRNYLLPVNARLTSERALRFEALEVNDILEELERAGARVSVVVLDACRNNPFEKKFRGGSRGLAVVDAAQGTLIAYATAPGSVAADGDGMNGLYTQELLRALEVPGLKVEEVFKEVRRRVVDLSSGQQIPWESSSLTGDFVFNMAPGDPAARPASGDTAELALWRSVQESNTAADYSDYLAQYPAGTFANVARRRLDQLANQVDRCDDLSGRWYAWIKDDPDPVCRDTFTVERVDQDQYEIDYAVCGAVGTVSNIKGKASFADQVLEYKWKSMPCGGTTRYDLDAGCRGGTGQIVKRGGIPGLCTVFMDKSVIVEIEREE